VTFIVKVSLLKLAIPHYVTKVIICLWCVYIKNHLAYCTEDK